MSLPSPRLPPVTNAILLIVFYFLFLIKNFNGAKVRTKRVTAFAKNKE
jgi:hypothetical protein